MGKVVVRKIGVKNGRSGARPGVKKTRVRDSAGQPMQIYTLDVRSSTFGDDLTYVSQANVAAARVATSRASQRSVFIAWTLTRPLS